jgi:hypothetical protein
MNEMIDPVVKPVLRRLFTVQLHDTHFDDRGGFAPLDRDNYVILVYADIGPNRGEGDELVTFWVCSPTWISNNYSEDPWLRAMIILPHWDYDALVAAVEELCLGIEGNSWTEVGLRLSRFIDWEFQDEAAREAKDSQSKTP